MVQSNSIIQTKTFPKYKDLKCLAIAIVIVATRIEHTLMDLGASVNLLPYSMYQKLGLRELKPTNVTLQLADRTTKVIRGMVEDILVQVDKFYFLMEFIVLDTQPSANPSTQILVIFGRPFLATSNAFIQCT